jgi:hypothetical protein
VFGTGNKKPPLALVTGGFYVDTLLQNQNQVFINLQNVGQNALPYKSIITYPLLGTTKLCHEK